jgi:Uma2 family endonuclease
VIEILSDTDRWDDLLEKVELYARNGAAYVVAIDPFENVVETRGEPPNGLALDIRAIIEA